MKKSITISILLICFTASYIAAQTSSYNFASSSGTFQEITGGTVLGTTSNDEQVFNNNTTGETGPQTDIGFPIGFNFNYNGVLYDRFAVNNNGWIKLGTGTFTIGSTTTPISNSGTTGFENIFSAMGRDLQGQTGSQLSYLLTGTAPNRVLVVQWLKYRKLNGSSSENYNFQIRLNESNNTIQFVYGSVATTNTSTTAANNTTQVGIRGAVNSDYENRTTTSSWSSSSTGTSNANTMRLTTTVKPASGLTYTFTPGNMSYSSSTTVIADTSSVKKGSVNNPVIRIQVVVGGMLNSVSLTSLTCKTNGTTFNSDITNARIWYSGISPVFSTAVQFGSVIANPSGTINFEGSQELLGGTNYFWLTYDVPLTATTGNFIDGECSSLTVGSARTPSTQAPSGNRKISNTPLTGTYTIGLAMFNIVSGKNLYYKKIEKPALVISYTRDQNRSGKSLKDNNQNDILQDLSKTEFNSKEDTFILMDGDVPFNSPGYIEITPALRSKFGSSILTDEINGIYSSFTAAANDIGSRGVQGPVVFSLVDEVYSTETFPVTFNSIYGTSSVNTVTIKPAEGVTPVITMTTGTSIFKIVNSSYITIDGSNTNNGTSRDLSLISNYASISNCVWIGSTGTAEVQNITVKNCNVKTGENSLGSSAIMVSDGTVSGNAGYFSDITIQNNFVQKGRQGIYINGGILPQNGSNVYVYDNVINSTGADAVGYIGIYLQGVNNAEIRGNEVGNLNSNGSENDKGIWIANGSHNVTAAKNKVYSIGSTGTSGNGGHGIYISANHLDAGVLAKNNIIYDIYGDGWDHTSMYYLDNPAAIMLYSSTPQSGISILNNSINLFGNTLAQNLAVSSGIFLTSGTTADIRNNVIVNNLGVSNVSALGSFCIYAQTSNSQFLNIDYNNYFSNPTGTGTKAIGMISSVVSVTLNNWKIATGKDRSSLNYEAGYTANTNLQPDANNPYSWSLNGRGTQLAQITDDYAGSPRSTTVYTGAPDIGAYEFTPAALPPFAVQTGSIADGSTSYYLFGGDTVVTITWHGTNLPSGVSARYFSGNNPPSATTGNFGNSYVSFTPTGGSNYTFDLTLYYDPALIGTISDENNISLANYTTGSWTHYDASLITPLRKVTKTGISQLSVFTIDDNESPMPVTLKYFNSNVSGRNVMLEWVTISEINNSGFQVERKSEFESKWVKVGFIQGSGTVNEEKHYSFTDKNLNTAKYSFRLKQIDYSGAVEYLNLNNSVIIGKPVEFGISQNYPNPSNPNAKIDFQIPQNSVVQLKIYDISGKEVGTIVNGYLEAGYHTAEFDGTNLASGVYFYRISSENFSKTMKLILVK